jgi:translocation and assembly module TamA
MKRRASFAPARALAVALLCSAMAAARVAAADAPEAAASAPAGAASAPEGAASAPPNTRAIVIEAPDKLRELLQANLDIERATRLAATDSLDDSEWGRLVAVAPAQARELLETEGYFGAQVQAAADATDPQVIRIHVEPGQQATVGRLTIEFDGIVVTKVEQGDADATLLEKQVRDAWPLKPGKPFRNGDWSSAKSQVLSKMRTQGYAAVAWTATSAQVDPATDTVRLFMVVDSGPQFLAGNLVVEGLERQPEKAVRDLAGWGPGVPLTQQRLQDYTDRLTKTGLFDQVAVVYDPDPEQAAHATVTVHVHEPQLQQVTVAVGYGSTSGPHISLEHKHRLIFGYPATLTNKIQYGNEIQQWDIDLATHPAENFHSWVAGGSVGLIRSTDDVVRTQYIRFGRTRDTSALDRLVFGQVLHSDTCTPASFPGQVVIPQPYDCVNAFAVSINEHVVVRRLDSIVLPTEGWSLSGQVGSGMAGSPSTNWGPYLRLYGRLTGYEPLGDSWFGQARVEAGQIIVKDTVAMPDAEQWRAGGEDSVRGYEWRALGPLTQYQRVVGGNALVTTSVEVSHPFTARLPSVWWAAFVDAGRAAYRFSDLTMALGYGLGLRWRSPVGPLRVDWSWGEEVHRGRIDLAVGIAF